MVLRELGALLASKSRNEDIACRLGGEEFMLCLPGAAREIAETRAVEIREALQQLKLPYDGTDIGPITVSIGISIFPDLGNTSADLMKKADIALYRAKQNGRDRVVIAEPNNGTLQLIPNQTRK